MTNSYNTVPSDSSPHEAEYIETKGGIRYYLKIGIWRIRDQPVMMDGALADVYGIKVRDITKAITKHQRNSRRFTEAYVFMLTSEEYREIEGERRLASLLRKRRSLRDLPRVFTKRGAHALSFVFHTDAAIEQANRVFDIFEATHELFRRRGDEIATIVASSQKDVIEKMTDIRCPWNDAPWPW